MTTEDDVAQFLQEFKAKKAVWGVRVYPRDKNDETILSLDISYAYVEGVLDTLVPTDYSEGPLTEEVNMGRPMWVFRKVVKGKDIYVKISIGDPNKMARCYSFHFPLHPMSCPFKT